MKKVHIQGFSLLELTIVLAILGLFIGGAIGAYSRWVEKQLYEEAVQDIENAKKAIIGFSVANGWLPCPDIVLNNALNAGNGIEDRDADGDGVGGEPTGACTVLAANQVRIIPFTTLSLPATDPWGNPYFYYAETAYTNDTAAGGPFNLTTTLAMTVDDGNVTGLGAQVIANQVAFVVYSRGPDGGNTPTIQQNENRETGPASDDDLFSSTTYLPYNNQATPGTGDDTGFDDIISWVSTHVLKFHMVEAQRLP